MQALHGDRHVRGAERDSREARRGEARRPPGIAAPGHRTADGVVDQPDVERGVPVAAAGDGAADGVGADDVAEVRLLDGLRRSRCRRASRRCTNTWLGVPKLALKTPTQVLKVVLGLEQRPADLLVARRGDGVSLAELEGRRAVRGPATGSDRIQAEAVIPDHEVAVPDRGDRDRKRAPPRGRCSSLRSQWKGSKSSGASSGRRRRISL